MGLLRDWGFSEQSWRGQRGEYWVLLQVLLILGFVVLPVVRLSPPPSPPGLYGLWAIATVCAGFGIVFLGKGVWDLGRNLTPLPYPREDGAFVQAGVYQVVRHPLYSGVIFVAIAWALYQWSLSHGLGGVVLFVFLDAKAQQEENWLTQKYPDYGTYRQHVKKLIPWVY